MVQLRWVFYSHPIHEYKIFGLVTEIILWDIHFKFAGTNNPLILEKRADTILAMLDILDNSFFGPNPCEVQFVVEEVEVRMKISLDAIKKIISVFNLQTIIVEDVEMQTEEFLQAASAFESFISKIKTAEKKLLELIPTEEEEEEEEE